MTTAELSELVTHWVQEVMGEDVKVDFGRFPTAAHPCVVRQVAVDPVVKRYLSGSGILRYTYDVMVLSKTLGISVRSFSALEMLNAIVVAVRDKAWPQSDEFACYGHSVDLLPQQYLTAEDGQEVFYMRCTITYFSERI